MSHVNITNQLCGVYCMGHWLRNYKWWHAMFWGGFRFGVTMAAAILAQTRTADMTSGRSEEMEKVLIVGAVPKSNGSMGTASKPTGETGKRPTQPSGPPPAYLKGPTHTSCPPPAYLMEPMMEPTHPSCPPPAYLMGPMQPKSPPPAKLLQSHGTTPADLQPKKADDGDDDGDGQHGSSSRDEPMAAGDDDGDGNMPPVVNPPWLQDFFVARIK